MNTTPKKWLSLALSMKYITNTTILAAVIGYYTQAYWIFLVSIPLLITNALVMTTVQWFNADELTSAVLDIPSTPMNQDTIQSNKTKFVFLNTIWHWVPLAWVWYVLERDNLIQVFRPNFMGVFLAGVAFAIGYFYFASQGQYYGEIEYMRYMVLYVIILFATCISLYG